MTEYRECIVLSAKSYRVNIQKRSTDMQLIKGLYRISILCVLIVIAVYLVRIDRALLDWRPVRHYIEHNNFDVAVEPGAAIVLNELKSEGGKNEN